MRKLPLPRRALAILAAAYLALCLAIIAAFALTEYVDPWGLPSGTATLKLASQQAIGSGAKVHGFDFASGAVDSLHSYLEIVALGEIDLIFFELHPDSSRYFLRAPEDSDEFDRDLIVSLADSLDLEAMASMPDSLLLTRFVPAQEGHAYLLLQIRAGAAVETTAVKFELSALADSSATFNWVWQPNGSREFIPTATREQSLSAIKRVFR